MRHAGNEIAVQSVEAGLFCPVNENDVDSGEDDEHQETAFCKNHPVPVGVHQEFGLEFFRELHHLLAVANVPVYPDAHEYDPGDLHSYKYKNRVKQCPQSIQVKISMPVAIKSCVCWDIFSIQYLTMDRQYFKLEIGLIARLSGFLLLQNFYI